MKTSLSTIPAPSHLFNPSGDAGLYDTRRDNWTDAPIRPVFSSHFREIKTPAEMKATIRAGEFAWPGMYQLYFVTSDGGALSFASARKNLRSILDSIKTQSGDGWRVVGCQVNYEDTSLYCDDSGEKIPAAYGE